MSLARLSRSAQLRPVALAVRSFGTWSHVPQGPPDPILGLTSAFNNDTAAVKVSLGVGAYRDDAGKPYVLQSVRKAERKLLDKNVNMEYCGIDGVPKFVKLAQELTFGADHPLVKNNLLASTQTISGTGALRVACEYLKRFLPADSAKKVYIPTPSWANHKPICKDAGLEVADYRYYQAKNNGLNFDGLLEDIKNAPDRSVFMFHACAHNPTGVDPTMDQWKAISKACKEKKHIIFFDSAYQGFASGDPTRDSQSYRHFIDDGHQIILCQSFAKNMGLYGHRTGCFHVTCADAKEQEAVLSQLKIVVRPMYSNPPIYGANVAAEVLGDAELNAEWRRELKGMADRIKGMREALVNELKKQGSTRNWSHITDQIGMFCYTGLTEAQVEILKKDYHVYMTKDGRISLAGLNPQNLQFVASGIHNVTKN